MSWNYVSSIHKGYAVSSALKVNIETNGKIEERLLVARFNILEFFIIHPNKIELDFQIDIFANITKVAKLTTDLQNSASFLFILADNFDYGFVSIKDKQVITKYHGNATVRADAKDPSDIKIIHDFSRVNGNVNFFYLALVAHKGYMHIFNLKLSNNNDLLMDKTMVARLPHEKTLDVGALYNLNFKTTNPLIAILYEDDYKEKLRNLHVYELNLQLYELQVKKPLWEMTFSEDLTVFKLHCLRDGSIFVISETTISHYLQSSKFPTSQQQLVSEIQFVEEIPGDPDRFLISESKQDGSVYLMAKGGPLSNPNEIVTEKSKSTTDKLLIKFLGKVSYVNTISCLTNSLFFSGSEAEDSHLFNISDENTNDLSMPYLVELDVFLNLGFISDLKIMKKKAISSASLIAASYRKKKQQINILNSGINMNIEKELQCPQVKNFWLFKGSEDLLFFITTTRNSYSFKISTTNFVIYRNDLTGFEENLSTIGIHQLQRDTFAQVTSQGITLFEIEEMKISSIDTIKPNFFDLFGDILLSVSFDSNLYLVTKEQHLVQVDTKNKSLQTGSNKKFESQISALTTSKNHLFVSFWEDENIHVLNRENLAEVYVLETERKGVSSILSTTLDTAEFLYLFVGYFDGLVKVFRYSFMQDGNQHEFEIIDEKSYMFGSHPVSLQEEKIKGKTQVLVFCDNAALFQIKEQDQLHYLNLLSSDVKKIALLEEYNPNNCLALVERNLIIAELEFHDKVQTKNLPFDSNDEINFILPLVEYNLYAAGINNTEEEIAYLKLYDSNSYAEIDSLSYEGCEINCLLRFDYQEFRGVLLSTRTAAGGGRIEIFEISENRLHKIQHIDYMKDVLMLAKLLDKYVVAAVGSSLIVLKIQKNNKENMESFTQESYSFEEVASKNSFAVIWQVQTFKEYILLVDNIKGLNLYWFNEEENKLMLSGKSMNNALGNEMGCIIDEEWFALGTETNLKILKKNKTGESDNEKIVFQSKANINIGERITCVLKDQKTLVDRLKGNDTEDGLLKTVEINFLVLAGMKGSVTLMAVIPENLYTMLLDIQQCIISSLPKGFGYDYIKWRGYKDAQSREFSEPKGFIDGDVIKRIFDMSKKEIDEISSKMTTLDKPPLQEVLTMLEDLNKIV